MDTMKELHGRSGSTHWGINEAWRQEGKWAFSKTLTQVWVRMEIFLQTSLSSSEQAVNAINVGLVARQIRTDETERLVHSPFTEVLTPQIVNSEIKRRNYGVSRQRMIMIGDLMIRNCTVEWHRHRPSIPHVDLPQIPFSTYQPATTHGGRVSEKWMAFNVAQTTRHGLVDAPRHSKYPERRPS